MSIIVHSRRTFLGVAMLVLAIQGVVPAATQSVAQHELSDSIQISPMLRAQVEDMLRLSPTFRAQYRRIAEAPSIVVGVQVDFRLPDSSCRARSVFRRYNGGLIVVAVSIARAPRQAEWIAHEFEHIIEQLDGRNLSALAGRRGHGVWYSGPGVFETSRAVLAGRVVRDELRRRIQRSDNFGRRTT